MTALTSLDLYRARRSSRGIFGPQVYRSGDGGQTWVGISAPPLRSNDGNLYCVIDEGGVVSSSDNGQIWTAAPGSESRGGRGPGHIVELDDGTWVSMGVDSMIASRDSGQTRGTG